MRVQRGTLGGYLSLADMYMGKSLHCGEEIETGTIHDMPISATLGWECGPN